MGNLVRPESHPEPRGFPVQWADPGVKRVIDLLWRCEYLVKFVPCVLPTDLGILLYQSECVCV